MKQMILDLNKALINIEILKDTKIKGVYIGKAGTNIKSKILITFKKTHIKATADIRSVLYDDSKLNLDCKLVIPSGITKVDGNLNIKVLNLSDDVVANITPSLEILENDVKCSHALTIGRPDKKQILYLMSRGISLKKSIELIVLAFTN